MKNPTGPIKPYHKGNVSEDLFAAASRLIESEGLKSLTVRRLCREVGVTAANFYNHYPSLEVLLLDLAAAWVDLLSTSTNRIIKRAKPREEKLVEITIQYVEFSLEHPDLFRVMYGQVSGSGAHGLFYSRMEDSFSALVKLVYGEDIYRADDVAWSHIHCRKAYAFFAFAYGLARLISMQMITFASGTKAERQKFVREMAWTFANGLDGPEPPQR
jgi:AcrR family transcriptional regulator